MNKKIITHVAVGVAGLGVGFGIGWFAFQRKAIRTTEALLDQTNAYWRERLNEAEGPAAIITSGESITTPVFDELLSEQTPETTAIIEAAVGEAEVEATPMYVDQASNLGDEDGEQEEELPPDFPDAPVVVSDDFTVEGVAPAVDARAFVEQFKNRKVEDFGGVTYPGLALLPTDDEESEGTGVVKTVPDFVLVRDPNGPYVISIDDFMDPETDPPFTKVEMRWFAGDNVVVDARDDQVPMSTVGQANTTKFGEGTTDPNQVYIRNERLSIDIELTREDGLYLHEVLGQDYPDKTPVLRMRQGDDS